MIIHHASDLHYELNGATTALDGLPGGDLLVLNGDIHCARFFAEKRTDAESRGAKKMMRTRVLPLLSRYDEVIHIMGNHEHYGYDYRISVETFQDFYEREGCKNVVVTDALSREVGGIPMVFTTLWSDLDAANPVDRYHIERGMNDYRVIKGMTPEVSTAMHRTMAEFVFDSKPLLVFSHHAPSFESETRYRGSTLSAAYCTELSSRILDTDIEYWVHGHTHSNTSYDIGKCKVRTAMYGYYTERSRDEKYRWGEIVL